LTATTSNTAGHAVQQHSFPLLITHLPIITGSSAHTWLQHTAHRSAHTGLSGFLGNAGNSNQAAWARLGHFFSSKRYWANNFDQMGQFSLVVGREKPKEAKTPNFF